MRAPASSAATGLPSLTKLLLPALLSSVASAQSFTPVADAKTDYDNPLTNYGSGDLGVDTGTISASFEFTRSYLRFVVSGINPETIDCVTLELTESTKTGNVHFEVRRPATFWDENTVTWATQPSPIGARIGAWIGSGVSNGETIEVALNPSAFAAGDGTYDLMLIESNSGGVSGTNFGSRETGTAPRLVFGCAGLGPRAGVALSRRDGAVPFTPNILDFIPEDTTAVTWDFGDGTTSTDLDPSHTYLTPGRYDLSVTATNPQGTVSLTRSAYVMAYPPDQAAGSVLSSTEISSVSPGGAGLGLSNGDMFGRAVGVIGDINEDGVQDIIVGAIGNDDAGDDAGAVYIVTLKANGSIKSSLKITEGVAGFGGDLDSKDGFGREVAGIGDWDGDGVPDVAVGANRDDDDGGNAGAVWLLFLNANGTVKAYTKINATNGAPIGFNGGDEFGRGIARMEDMDGDGVPELAVGAINNTEGGQRYGCVWILFMRTDGSVKSASKITPTSGGLNLPVVPNGGGRCWFGMSVAALGDLDGNGVTDLVVGALLDSARPSASGAGIVVLMKADGTAASGVLINGNQGGLVPGEITSNDELGGNCAGIGDLDGDGIPDMAITSIRGDDNPEGNTDYFADYGEIYVCFLNSDGTLRDYQKISATRGGLQRTVNRADRIGEGLSGLGDFNGDGIVDLLVGSRFDDAGGTNRGAVAIYHLDNGLGGVAPVADFSASPLAGSAPLLVSFSDQSVGEVDSWMWDFGDGTFSTQPSPTHTYAAAGSYDVSLDVSGPLGSDSLTKPGLIDVAPMGSNIVAYGSGVNPSGSLVILGGSGAIGTPLTFGVDNPLGTQAPGSTPFITFTRNPAPGFPSGMLLPGFGMDGGPGELLVDLSVSPILSMEGGMWSGPGNPVSFTLNIPPNPTLIGLTFYAQGRLNDTSPGASVVFGLTSAFAITIIP